MQTVNLLWSGGWDGTFRFLQLAKQEVKIQPIYMIDRGRGSWQRELRAIHEIIEAVKSPDFGLKAEILEPKTYELEWIRENCHNEKIEKSYEFLREKYDLGTQYVYLALLADHFGFKYEMGIVHQIGGKSEEVILKEGEITPMENDTLEGRYYVRPKGENETASTLFRDAILPILYLSKKDEENISRENGWLDIMKLSWFCYNPDRKGQPCGWCNPCIDAMNTGMGWRLPECAVRRYNHRMLYKSLLRTKRKVIKMVGVVGHVV
jgi:7-cyano-7-deazaguanine synthase